MKLGIGTAQFGLDYGISNKQGKTPPQKVSKILELAHNSGVNVIDTAHLYGTSEEVLGKVLIPQYNFDIITKTPQFLKNTLTRCDSDFLELKFYQSLERLGKSAIYALLIHNADDLLANNGHLLMEKMLSFKQHGLIQKIGVSVYNSEQIDKIVSCYSIDIIQLPINVLDQRLIISNHLAKLKKLGIEIHARSIFLQGLLLMNIEHIPSYFDSVIAHLKEYQSFIYGSGFSKIEAAISFILSLSEIDKFICGVNNYQQLKEILSAIKKLETKPELALTKFAISDNTILNPSEWNN